MTLGDSLYEAKIFVAGTVASLGARLRRKGDGCGRCRVRRHPPRSCRYWLATRLVSGVTGSARRLYNFHIDPRRPNIDYEQTLGLRALWPPFSPEVIAGDRRRLADEGLYKIRGFGTLRPVAELRRILVLPRRLDIAFKPA